jgi:hypothetical protein
MNGKGCGRKRPWPNFRVLSNYLPRMIEKNDGKPHSGYSRCPTEIRTEHFSIKSETLESESVHEYWNVNRPVSMNSVVGTVS